LPALPGTLIAVIPRSAKPDGIACREGRLVEHAGRDPHIVDQHVAPALGTRCIDGRVGERVEYPDCDVRAVHENRATSAFVATTIALVHLLYNALVDSAQGCRHAVNRCAAMIRLKAA
jgi:hypothetical protein